jgi:hypothetical protein
MDQIAWIDDSISAWKKIQIESLKIRPGPLPWLILFDEQCVVHINPDKGYRKGRNRAKRVKIAGEKVSQLIVGHEGIIPLPENGEVPAQLLSFAAPYAKGTRSFLVSALPQIWKAAPHMKEEKHVEVLARSVFVHEMTHTLHRPFYGRLDLLEKQLGPDEQIDDDIVQKKFGETEAFSNSIEAEKQLLYSAAAAPDRDSQLKFARLAFTKITERRKRHFAGDAALFAELEDVFLAMEGAANWAAYRAALDQGLRDAEALALIRRGGKYWSQDLGLAIYLTVDKLLPGWQKRAFAKRPATALELLSDAVK